jgi:hypothetical protein
MLRLRSLLIVSSLVLGSAIAPMTIQFLSTESAAAQIWPWFRRQPKIPLATRTTGLCPVTPGLLEKTPRVISDRPLFSWQGEAVELTVRDEETNEIVWTTKLDPKIRQIAYGGQTPLQPNKVYKWQILEEKPSPSDLETWDAVALVRTPEREQHLAKLKEIEQTSKGSSSEAIVQEKVAYLLDENRQLWSDAVQLLSEVKNPSLEFSEQRTEFLKNLCPKNSQ